MPAPAAVAKKKPPKRRPKRRPVARAPRRRRPGALTALLLAAAAGAIVAAALSVGEEPGAATVAERTVTVSRGVIESVVSGSGNLAPARQADVDFAAGGRITKVYATVGEHVSKGELLARVDDRAARVAVAKAQAELVEAQDALEAAADEENATAAATPTATAVAAAAQASPTATPQQQAPSSGLSVQAAQAAVDSADLALAEAQDALAATRLRAPMAGTVASVSGAAGDEAGAGESAFIVLAALSKLKLDVALSESDIGKVEVGQTATVTVNAASGEKVAGEVTDVGVLASEAQEGSGAVSYPVTVTLEQTTGGLKSGMSATADIVVARARGLVVPSQALTGSAVTVERAGRRSTQRVQTGVVGDGTTQIVSGLNEGDTVVVTSTTVRSSGAQQPNQGAFGGGGGFGGARRLGGGGGFQGGGPPPGGP
jgi:macrolide-specific efflux system membrane fusion protein